MVRKTTPSPFCRNIGFLAFIKIETVFLHICRQTKSLEDDIYSFGIILLESLIGPSVHARKESFLLNEMVNIYSSSTRKHYSFEESKPCHDCFLQFIDFSWKSRRTETNNRPDCFGIVLPRITLHCRVSDY